MATKTNNLGLSKAELTDAVRSTLTANNGNFDKIDDHIARLKENQPKGTASGIEIVVEDSANIESVLHISGNSEQDSRSGKNMFDANVENLGTIVATKVVEDNKVIITASKSGTNTYARLPIPNSDSLLGKTMTLSFEFNNSASNNGGADINQIDDNGNVIGWIATLASNGSKTFTMPSTYTNGATKFGIFLFSNRNGTGNAGDKVTYTNIQIEEGSTATSYEPYGVQPSPDYPSEIRSVKSKSDNILPQELFTTATTVNGITFTPNADGSIKIKGTATARADLHLTTKLIEKLTVGKTYTSSIGQEMTSNLRMVVEEVKGSSWVANISYASKTTWAYNGLTSGDAYRVLLAIDSGSVLDTTIYPMINEGDKALPYQLYGYVPVEAKVEGKNMFNKDNFETLHLGIDNNTKVFYNASTFNSFYIKCKSNTTYTVSKISSKRFTIATCMDIPTVDGVATNLVGKDNGTQLTITSGINDKYLWVYYYKSDTDTLTEQEILNTIQIEEGSTATPYEPYKLTTVELPLGDIELRSTPNGTRDTFERVDGVWNYRGNIYSEIFDGSSDENIEKNPYGTNSYRIPVANRYLTSTEKILTITNRFTSKNYNDRTLNTPNILYTEQQEETYSFVTVRNTNFTTLDEFKTWLSSNPTQVDYALATPTYTPITDTALIQALDKLEQLILHKGYNRITVTSVNGVKAYLDLSYTKDINIVLNNIITKLGGL